MILLQYNFPHPSCASLLAQMLQMASSLWSVSMAKLRAKMNADLAVINPPLPHVRWAWAKWLNPSQSLAAAESIVTALSYCMGEFKGIWSVYLATSLRTVLEEKTCFSLGARVHNFSACIHVMNVSVCFHSYRRCETFPRQSRFNRALQSPDGVHSYSRCYFFNCCKGSYALMHEWCDAILVVLQPFQLLLSAWIVWSLS